MSLRDKWRLAVLVVLLVGSGVALFGPGVGASGGGDATNLVYGIQLDGGSRIRAPVAAWTVTNVTAADPGNVSAEVAAELDLDPIDVQAVQTPDGTAIEVRSRNVTESQVVDAFRAAGVEIGPDQVRRGVTEATRQQIVAVIDEKISQAGLGGGSVSVATTLNGQHYIVVEAPNRGVDELESLIRERGVVRVEVYYPNQNGTYVNETVLRQGDFSSIGTAQVSDRDVPFVPVTVADTEAQEFAQEMVAAGFTSDTRCDFNGYGAANNSGRCLLVVSDGEVINSFGVEGTLASSFQDGDFVKDPAFRMTLTSRDEARELAVHLRAGALPAPLDFEERTLYTIEPALAEQFKTNSLLTGILAVLAVSLVVFLRYGDVRVAAPMVLTALSEVVLLLGFAAAVRYPLDLSVIAGFIAVIGTGVDDLIIIADEVMAEGDVNSSRVFRSRFRKALWVIGAAAATTILAMSPLAVLSLGDLQGFAIVTILGVLVGVLITRPAYGDILRTLLTDR